MPPNKNVGVPVTAYDEDEGDGIYYSIKTEMPFNVIESTDEDGNITTYSGVFGIDSSGQVYLAQGGIVVEGDVMVLPILATDSHGAKTEQAIEVEILPAANTAPTFDDDE